ncbi:hypothetical protein [Clostridium sp.]|uniref:hypothetical protein n=1 Tax=Clostridium sp. TaxID=1506 RepID=UPI003F360AB5
MMHREVVSRKKVPVIIMSLLVVTIALYVLEFVELSWLDKHVLGSIISGIILLLTIVILLKELKSCKLSYKHSIIADKLIINEICSKEEKNLESIKINDILYIGKRSGIPKEYSVVRTSKNYLCDFICKDAYYCIFKKNNVIRKIKFQPSDLFIQRIIRQNELCSK